MSPTSFVSRQAKADARTREYLSRFVSPLFGETSSSPSNNATAESDTGAALPTSKAHQRPVKAPESQTMPMNTPDAPAEPSGASFGQIAAKQVKAYRRIKTELKAQARKHQAQAKREATPPPTPFTLSDLITPDLKPHFGKGKWRFLETLHQLCIAQYKAREYAQLPHQITLFLSNELLAAAFGVHTTTIWRWARWFEGVGILQARPHYSSSADVRRNADISKAEARKLKAQAQAKAGTAAASAATNPRCKKPLSKTKDTVVDGMVYAVRFRPGHRAHLHIDDMQHQYRDLDADRKAGHTAYNIIRQMKAKAQAQAENGRAETENLKMQGSLDPREWEWYSILETWAVKEEKLYTVFPLESDHCNFESAAQASSIAEIIQAIPLIRDCHPRRRHGVVGAIAQALTVQFGDSQYLKGYCQMLWTAWTEEIEGRRGLLWLMDNLARIQGDLHEWPELRSPGALLLWRLKNDRFKTKAA